MVISVPVVPVILTDVAPGEAVVHTVLHAVHEGAGDVVVLGHVHTRVLDDLRSARHVGLVPGLSYRPIHVVNLKKWEMLFINFPVAFCKEEPAKCEEMNIRKES